MSRYRPRMASTDSSMSQPPEIISVPAGFKATNNESQYLQANIGRALVAGISQVTSIFRCSQQYSAFLVEQIVATRAGDPIDALGRFLLNHDKFSREIEAETQARFAKMKETRIASVSEEEQRTRFAPTTWMMEDPAPNFDNLFSPPPPPVKVPVPVATDVEPILEVTVESEKTEIPTVEIAPVQAAEEEVPEVPTIAEMENDVVEAEKEAVEESAVTTADAPSEEAVDLDAASEGDQAESEASQE
ncbi:hypothetical protein BC830DRAFT_1135987 [Chytriomyces sp. MP71]|nr:hypothetical protein BC830DRAFT_1135987 [Chytriomyces sp. MP71]